MIAWHTGQNLYSWWQQPLRKRLPTKIWIKLVQTYKMLEIHFKNFLTLGPYKKKNKYFMLQFLEEDKITLWSPLPHPGLLKGAALPSLRCWPWKRPGEFRQRREIRPIGLSSLGRFWVHHRSSPLPPPPRRKVKSFAIENLFLPTVERLPLGKQFFYMKISLCFVKSLILQFFVWQKYNKLGNEKRFGFKIVETLLVKSNRTWTGQEMHANNYILFKALLKTYYKY